MSELYVLGIRHHGPGSARTVRAALDALQPDAVALELPADTASVLSHAADLAMEPPVALLGHVADHPDRAMFFPLAAFSPEWETLRWAHDRGTPVVPFDLPLAMMLASDGDGARAGAPLDPITELATAAGYDDPERWWEDVVEHRGAESPPRSGDDEIDAGLHREIEHGGALAAFAALGEAMSAVRSTVDEASGGELAREAHMRRTLRTMAAEGHERIAAVCGAWHVPALIDTFDLPAAADIARLRGRPRCKVVITWVPWSHRRLAAATGYGAGVSSPGWYAHMFAHPGAGAVPRWFAEVARLLRREDIGVSPDDLIAATRLADALAVMRDRPRPGLAEVSDAASAVLGGGRQGPLRLIVDRLVVGDQVGSVPPHIPMVPLARDLLARRKTVRLKPTGLSKALELDVRTELGRSRSILLHQLWALGVPWGEPDEGRRSSGTFRETWQLRWEPELEIRLIEASIYGTTVAGAASAKLVEDANRATSLAQLTGLAEQALLAHLAEAVGPIVGQIAAHAAEDRDVVHLMDVLGPLARVVRYGDVRSTDVGVLRDVVDGLVVRICAGLGLAAAGLDDEAAAGVADRLTASQAALALLGHPARDRDWPEALDRVATAPTTHPMVCGRVVRLLFDAGNWDTAAAQRSLSQALTPGTPPHAGASFVEGLLSGSGTILLHDRALLRMVDEWLAILAVDSFVDVVPLLRRTFATFEAAERRRLGELVTGRSDGRPTTPFGWDLDDDRAAKAMETVRLLLGVDDPIYPARGSESAWSR